MLAGASEARRYPSCPLVRDANADEGRAAARRSLACPKRSSCTYEPGAGPSRAANCSVSGRRADVPKPAPPRLDILLNVLLASLAIPECASGLYTAGSGTPADACAAQSRPNREEREANAAELLEELLEERSVKAPPYALASYAPGAGALFCAPPAAKGDSRVLRPPKAPKLLRRFCDAESKAPALGAKDPGAGVSSILMPTKRLERDPKDAERLTRFDDCNGDGAALYSPGPGVTVAPGTEEKRLLCPAKADDGGAPRGVANVDGTGASLTPPSRCAFFSLQGMSRAALPPNAPAEGFLLMDCLAVAAIVSDWKAEAYCPGSGPCGYCSRPNLPLRDENEALAAQRDMLPFCGCL